MADVRFNKEFCVVVDKNGKPILAKYLTGRVETNHVIKKYLKLADIPVKEIPELKEVKEDRDIYIKDGKAICDVVAIKEIIK